jgi:hypothetical protein
LIENETTIRSAIQSFCRLKASDFADTLTAVDAGIEPDTTWIQATLADGSIHRVRVGAPTERNRNFARKDGSEHIVIIPRGAINTMMPPFGTISLKPETETEAVEATEEKGE